jgi:hypothetical protein
MARDVAVVIVSWNVRALVLDALRTLKTDLATTSLDAEIWLVDCASADGTVEAVRSAFPQVHVIASEKNLGFAGGNNLALRAIGFSDTPSPAAKLSDNMAAESLPRAVFLLNADTRVQPGAMQCLYDTLLSRPDTGIVGAQLSYDDGSFQDSAFAVPGLAQLVIDLFPLSWLPGRVLQKLYESRLNGRYPRHWYASGRVFPVGHTLGATMFMRREAILQTGLFDEQFFMYCEEIDWSVRIHEAGWRIYCQPNAHIVHLGGQSTKQIRVESLVNLWKSRLLFYAKHYSPIKRWLARHLMRFGAVLRIRQARHLATDQQAAAINAYQAIRDLV